MKIVYMDRATYRAKKSDEVIAKLKNEFGHFYLIPEGGTNHLAVKGCAEIISSIKIDYDLVCSSCGTGGTLAGLIAGLNGTKAALGFAVLKGANFLNNDIKNLLEKSGFSHLNKWEINLDYHFGGYAKTNDELMKFIKKFEDKTGIKSEPIYTGKMLYGIYDRIAKGYIKEGFTIVAVHTGGLQGLAGLKQRQKYYQYLS